MLFGIDLLSGTSLHKGLSLKSVGEVNVYDGVAVKSGSLPVVVQMATGLVGKPGNVLQHPLSLFLKPDVPVFF